VRLDHLLSRECPTGQASTLIGCQQSRMVEA
jgi:hypothetical protein